MLTLTHYDLTESEIGQLCEIVIGIADNMPIKRIDNVQGKSLRTPELNVPHLSHLPSNIDIGWARYGKTLTKEVLDKTSAILDKSVKNFSISACEKIERDDFNLLAEGQWLRIYQSKDENKGLYSAYYSKINDEIYEYTNNPIYNLVLFFNNSINKNITAPCIESTMPKKTDYKML